MRIINFILATLKRMPRGLRYITAWCLGISTLMLFIGAIVPFTDQRINDVPALFALGGLFASLAYGFIRARRWVRPLFVTIGFALAAGTAVDDGQATTETVIAFLIFGAWPAWYLFYRKSVKNYFAEKTQLTA